MSDRAGSPARPARASGTPGSVHSCVVRRLPSQRVVVPTRRLGAVGHRPGPRSTSRPGVAPIAERAGHRRRVPRRRGRDPGRLLRVHELPRRVPDDARRPHRRASDARTRTGWCRSTWSWRASTPNVTTTCSTNTSRPSSPTPTAAGTDDTDLLDTAGEPFGASWEVRTVEDGTSRSITHRSSTPSTTRVASC